MPEDHIVIWWKRLYFILKSHLLTIFIMFVTAAHINEYVWRQKDKRFEFKQDILVHQNYPLLYFIGSSFWGFLWLTFFRNSLQKFPWWINFFITACMAWSSIPLLILPLLSAQLRDWKDAAYITLAFMVFHISLAMCREPFYEFEEKHLITWTIRGFVISSLGILLSIAWKSSHIDVIVAYFTLLYFCIINILFGRTIGSVQFYLDEIESKEWFYATMIHYNFMSVYAHTMLAMCKTRCVLASDRKLKKT